MNSASGVVCPRQGSIGRGIQNHIGPIAVGCLERGIDQRVHDLLQLQQPLRVIVELLQRDALLYQRSFDLTAQFLGKIQALGGQAIQMADQIILCIFQMELHYLMKLLIVLGKGSGNGQKQDHRREDHQDHGYPIEHQFSLHAYALLFGKGVQSTKFFQSVPHGVSPFLCTIAP